MPEFLEKYKLTEEVLHTKITKWETHFKKLLRQRKVPLIETKVLTSWNARLIFGLTQSYGLWNKNVPGGSRNRLSFYQNGCL